MVVKKSIDSLKGRPEEERKVVAGGIAVTSVVVLMVAWGAYFLHSISKGSNVNVRPAIPSEFDFTNVQGAQPDAGSQTPSGEDLTQLRNDAAAKQVQSQQIEGQGTQTQTQVSGTSQFGYPNTGE